MVPSVRAWGRRASPDQYRAAIAVGAVKRVGPIRGKTDGAIIVELIVQVFCAVTGRFYHYHATTNGKANGGEIVLPPLDSDEAPLILTILKVEPGARTVKFDQDD